MRWGYLAGDTICQQLQFLLSGEVSDVEAGMMLGGKLYCELGTLIASFSTTYLWVMNHLWIIAILKLSLRHIAIDNLSIFTMHHNGHAG